MHAARFVGSMWLRPNSWNPGESMIALPRDCGSGWGTQYQVVLVVVCLPELSASDTSPVAASGHVYLTSLEGAVTVLKVDAGKLVVVASAKLGERTAATPAIADDTLYIRTERHLYAFAEGK